MNGSEGKLQRILIMDDEAMIRGVAVKMLNRLGYEAEAVPDGHTALDAYEEAHASGHPFDLVIMDLTIPQGMDGREAISQLKQMHPEAKALVSSGYSSDPLVEQALDHGFDGVVSKPYSVKQLNDAIRQVLEAS